MTQRETEMIMWPSTKIKFKNWFCLKKTVFGYKINKKV